MAHDLKDRVTDDPDYPIKPEHIDASNGLFNTFDKMEREITAGWVINLCKKLAEEAGVSHWLPFTQQQMDDFYHVKWPRGHFCWNGLMDYLVVDGDQIHVTHSFVSRCFGPRR